MQFLEKGPMSSAQVEAAQAQIQKTLDDFGVRRMNYQDKVAQTAFMAGALTEAKKALAAQGMNEEQIKAMPPFQVVALHAVRESRQAWAEVVKWNHVADGWRQPGYEKDAKRFQEAMAR